MALKPLALKKGDLIAVAATASPFDVPEFEKGLVTLKELGFRVTYRKDIFEKRAFLAGTDERRAEELNQHLADPEVRAILFARGGWGTSRILPLLKKDLFEKKPKIVLGYSDLTSLLLYLQKLGWTVFHGPVVAKGLGENFSDRGKNSLLRAFLQKVALGPISNEGQHFILPGKSRGILIGGCLSLLISSLKTPWELDCENKILFIEDINEAPYKIDRMLTHLSLAGKFEGLKGVISGPFHSKASEEEVYVSILREHFGKLKIPVVYNFPSGHLNNMLTIPFGVELELDSNESRIEFLEGALHAA
ncbi:MAG: LD-carboxypeptidase [Deltaproteobacteria bacterium]|nr:LD-carboxypeptidase [Deltaproteobacteria bacterium]